MAPYSPRVAKIFDDIITEVEGCYVIANRAKAMGFDPDSYVRVPLAKNMAERVEGLISTVAPQILGKGVPERIQQLEEQFGSQDWRVALTIAEEVAKEKFCTFDSKKEAIEIGIRLGFSYVTVGVVSSPLEGFIGIDIRKRKDNGQEYFALIYGGPIRSAGGTGASVSVLIADYVRKKMGYATYDAQEKEWKRGIAELADYHERITNLQYYPSDDEVEFLITHLPVQLDGDPSEKYDVSNYKDLDRRVSNKISNGYCLITAECLCLKAPKVWKQLAKWGKDMDLDHWAWLGEFVTLQKEVKARGAKMEADSGEKEVKVKPDATFIKDIVAGRPVFTYPLRNGGFRLRYGRGRVSGFSADSVHPATMAIVNDFIAVGTQFKTERPGKSTTLNVCDELEGPIVRLKDGNVLQVQTLEEARRLCKDVEEIIYVGDILINWGDFLNRAHKLIPPGFVEEWWVYYAKEKFAEVGLDKEFLDRLYEKPIKTPVSFEQAVAFGKVGVPLHPKHIFYWNSIDRAAFVALYIGLQAAVLQEGKILVADFSLKRTLELIGVVHSVVPHEYLVIEGDVARGLLLNLGDLKVPLAEQDDVLAMVNSLCAYEVRDKCGYFIGCRMGRPEKAKMRKMKGSPHGLFPIGEEGGRLRCFQSALEVGKVTSQFPTYFCAACNKETILAVCEDCGARTQQKWYCRQCKASIEDELCPLHGKATGGSYKSIDVKKYFYKALEQTGVRHYPDLVKGVRGMTSVDKFPEPLVKVITRAKHNIHVNKDGTVRYDMTELPCTHFKPKEVGTSVVRLRELGYTLDCYGKELVDDNQVLELFAQDVILPACPESPEEGADAILYRVTKFIDEILVTLYKEKPYYNLEKKRDLVGHLIVAMSPHTAAGIICRVVGFSKVQGLYAHPLLHSIMRRDCFHYDTLLPIFDGNSWKNEKIGELVEILGPGRDVDLYGTRAVKVEGYKTMGYVDGKITVVQVNDFTSHKKKSMLLLRTECGRELKVTEDHVLYLKGFEKKEAKSIKLGDQLTLPMGISLPDLDISSFDLLDIFSNIRGLMVRNVVDFVTALVYQYGGRTKVLQALRVTKNTLDNFLYRDSFSLEFMVNFLSLFDLGLDDLPKGVKVGCVRDSISHDRTLILDEDLLYLIGLYVAEGYSRRNDRLNQVDFSASEDEIREHIARIVRKHFGLSPTWINEERMVYSSRLFYEFLTNFLACGSIASNKRIPSLLLTLPKERLKFLLQGYYDGAGSVSLSDSQVTCDSVSTILLEDLALVLRRVGIFTKFARYTKEPVPIVKEFYLNRDGKIPQFTRNKLTIPRSFYQIFYEKIGFRLERKQAILRQLIESTKPYDMGIELDENAVYSKVVAIEDLGEEVSYCLNVEGHKVLPHGILTNQCDGDEAGCMLLLDTLLNFSRKYLPNTRGVTQDAPLVLTGQLIPGEVDDMVFDMDVVSCYPLEMYEAAMAYKNPWDVKVDKLGDFLGTEKQYEGMMFTHDTDDFNAGVLCSAYKSLPTMKDKVLSQMDVAVKLRAVNPDDVARLVIERHFLRDIKGNLRKFSQQSFRCVACNEIYRRPPLTGMCTCTGKLIFTIAEGSVKKYLTPAIDLAENYGLPAYLQQTLLLLNDRIESVFGKEEEKQEGLNKWF